MWNTNRFSVLEVCLLQWFGNPTYAKNDEVDKKFANSDETGTTTNSTTSTNKITSASLDVDALFAKENTATDLFFEQILGAAGGKALSGVLDRMSQDGTNGFATELEEALLSLFDSEALPSPDDNDDQAVALVSEDDNMEAFGDSEEPDGTLLDSLAVLQSMRDRLNHATEELNTLRQRASALSVDGETSQTMPQPAQLLPDSVDANGETPQEIDSVLKSIMDQIAEVVEMPDVQQGAAEWLPSSLDLLADTEGVAMMAEGVGMLLLAVAALHGYRRFSAGPKPVWV